VGVYGMGAAAALLAMGLALAWGVRPPLMRGGALVMSMALLLALGQAWRAPDATHSAGQVGLTLLQGNVAQDQKYDAQRLSAPRWYAAQIAQAGPGLILAPETALPLPSDLWPPEWWAGLQPRRSDQAIMVGAPWREPGRDGYSNSVLAWSGTGQGYSNSALGLKPGADAPYRYDKHHLVPFGEFIPRGFRWFTEMMNIPLGDFARGAVGQPSLAWNGQRLAPNICYEDLFGEELAARFVNPGQAPTIFVNLSNIAWFGDSVAIEQHLQISRMRALEFRRPMLRATNTGATAIIDAEGRVTHRLPRLTRGVLDGEVQGRTGLTPFARWASAWGLAPLWALALGILLVAMALARRRLQA